MSIAVTGLCSRRRGRRRRERRSSGRATCFRRSHPEPAPGEEKIKEETKQKNKPAARKPRATSKKRAAPKTAAKKESPAESSDTNWTKTTADSKQNDSKDTGIDALDALIRTPKKEEEQPRKTSAGSSKTKPSKADINKAMAPVDARAQSCAKYSTGIVKVMMVVGGDGRVKSSKASGSLASTNAGKCVEMIARTAKFDPFSDSSFTFTHSFALK